MSKVIPLRPDEAVIVNAILEAARLLEQSHDTTATILSTRARTVTAAAMREVFRRLSWSEIARLIGEPEKGNGLNASIAMARKRTWWNDAIVEQVAGAIMSNYLPEKVQWPAR